MSKNRKKYPFKVRFAVLDGEINADEQDPAFVEIEIVAYTLNAAADRLSRALTKLCEETP